MTPRLDFIGLGLMGKPMAARLLEAGYTIAVHNRSRGAVHELATRGAIACTSGWEVAACSEVILTMLPDAPEVELLLLGPNGVLEGLARGSVPRSCRRRAVHAPLIFSVVRSLYLSPWEMGAPEYRQAVEEETRPAAPANSMVFDAQTGSPPPHVRHSEYRCIRVFARH